VVEVREHQIREILTEIVANRNAVSTVDDYINQFERLFALDFASDYLLQHFMVDARIKLSYVDFQTVPRLFCVFHRTLDTAHRAVYAAFLDARICVARED
jgi:hypothetical protein